MPTPRIRLAHGITFAAAVLTGCAATLPPAPSHTGQARYQRITEPAGTRHYQLKVGQSAQQPVPRVNPDPVYPQALVDLGLPPVTVVARLSVDTQGTVSAVWISRFEGTVAYRPAFEQAVNQTARRWRFSPLVIHTTTTHPHGPPTTESMAKPFSAWFRFHFQIVDGKPQTTSNKQS